MKKLGDQWIEIIDGQEHMFKAVVPIVNGNIDVKDLGLLKDGLLPCPFCGEYPELYSDNDENEELIHIVEHECDVIIVETGWRRTKQEAKDAWNRRA